MVKFQRLKTQDIKIPKDVITIVSDKKKRDIVNSFGTESEVLFFAVVIQDKGKYTLVDRYDVYVAATSKGRKTINCAVLQDYDSFSSHMTLSLKPLPNPITVLRLIKPYVEKYGMEQVSQMFHLNIMYGRMYARYPHPHVLGHLERLVQLAHTYDAQTIVPLKMFDILYDATPKDANLILLKLEDIINTLKAKFRWPTNEILTNLYPEAPKVKKERTAINDIREYECDQCKAQIVITPNHVGLREEKDGLIMITGEDKSEPHYVPNKYKKHLHITPDTPPTVISSKDVDDWSALRKRLKNKNYLIFVDGS